MSKINNRFFQLRNYLFQSDHLFQTAWMRIVLCSTLFYLSLSRFYNIDQYELGSLIPRDQAMQLFPEFYRPFFHFFIWPDSLSLIIHCGLTVLYFLAAVGLSNRFFLLLTWAIAQGFIQRNYSMLFGADVIGNLFLFYLSMTKCCEVVSLKKYFTKNDSLKGEIINFSTSSSVFFRLMQIQICVIYAYTGLEKLKGSSWWDGTALWTVMVNPQFTQFNLEFLRYLPVVFAFGTFVTIIFEIYFPVMVAFRKTRYYWLGAGVFFHLGIGFLLSLMTFSLVMLSTYFLFMKKEKLELIWPKIALNLPISLMSNLLSRFKTIGLFR